MAKNVERYHLFVSVSGNLKNRNKRITESSFPAVTLLLNSSLFINVFLSTHEIKHANRQHSHRAHPGFGIALASFTTRIQTRKARQTGIRSGKNPD